MRAITGGSVCAQPPLRSDYVAALEWRSGRSGSDCSGVAPPPMTDCPGQSSAARAGNARDEQRVRRARGSRPRSGAIMPSAGMLSQRSSSTIAQRGFQRLVDHLVEPQRAKHGLRRRRATRSRASRQDAGLRSAEQLIAAEGDQVRAGLADCRETSGSSMPNGAQVDDAAAAQILVDGNAALAAERRQLAQFGPRGESRDAEVAADGRAAEGGCGR